jgi:D-glycero-D-manno-heptose 1,7-bisphosphate phosphatase
MSRQKAIFFDRDNTLIVNDGYLGDPGKVVLMEGAAAAIARGRRLGFAIVVFSNQSGVARGLFDEAAVRAVDQRMAELLLADDPAAMIDCHEFCPFHPQAMVEQYRRDSSLRKPGPGMILKAQAALELDLAASWVIGDAPRDIEAGQAAGCHTILFTPAGVAASPAALPAHMVTMADFSVATLGVAIDVIARHMAEMVNNAGQTTKNRS